MKWSFYYCLSTKISVPAGEDEVFNCKNKICCVGERLKGVRDSIMLNREVEMCRKFISKVLAIEFLNE